ncbi:hypothetical protein HED54_10940 [Ochrobactrum anthropi ATCC 49188]|nr:hypothetical protein [Brucella anthropi ATCC 49188]
MAKEAVIQSGLTEFGCAETQNTIFAENLSAAKAEQGQGSHRNNQE